VAYDRDSIEEAMALARARGASEVTVVDITGYSEKRRVK
jgi:electron transfer flavoprotein alpha/beta subunit